MRDAARRKPSEQGSARKPLLRQRCATIANCGAVMAQAMTEDCLIHASAGYTPLGKRRIVPAAAVQPFGRAFAWRPIPSPLPGAGRGMKCEGAAPLHRRNTAIPRHANACHPPFVKGAFGSGEARRFPYTGAPRERTDQKAPFLKGAGTAQAVTEDCRIFAALTNCRACRRRRLRELFPAIHFIH